MPKAKKEATKSGPERSADGTIKFKDAPGFTPNLTPSEVLQMGSFGGGYFRKIYSGLNKETYEHQWKEFPKEWFEGIDIKTQVTSAKYRNEVNKFKVRSGVTMGKDDAFGLLAWESSGWMHNDDPYGWFQWYCRFYNGRRSDDDERQIGRWSAVCGAKGRWKTNLIAKCVAAGKAYDDPSVSPVVRQTLQHWAYQLTEEHYNAYAKKVRAGAKTAYIGQLFPTKGGGGGKDDKDDKEGGKRKAEEGGGGTSKRGRPLSGRGGKYDWGK